MRTIFEQFFSVKAAETGGVVIFPDARGAERIVARCLLRGASNGAMVGTLIGDTFTELTVKVTKPGVVAIAFYVAGKNEKTSGWQSVLVPVTVKDDKTFVDVEAVWVPKGNHIGGANESAVWAKIGGTIYTSTSGVLSVGMVRVPDASLLLSFLNGDEGVTEETVTAAAEEQKKAVAVQDQLLAVRTVLAHLAVALKVGRSDEMDDATFYAAVQSEAATHSGILHEANWRANLMKDWGPKLDLLQSLFQRIADALGLVPGTVQADEAGVAKASELLFPLMAESLALRRQAKLLQELVDSPTSQDTATSLDLAIRHVRAMRSDYAALRGQVSIARRALAEGLTKSSRAFTGFGANALLAKTARHLATMGMFQVEDES